MTESKRGAVYIYTLSDPDTKQIMYVGQSVDPKKRLAQHIGSSLKSKERSGQWIRHLRLNNRIPLMSTIDECCVNDALAVEGQWIRAHLIVYRHLLNSERDVTYFLDRPKVIDFLVHNWSDVDGKTDRKCHACGIIADIEGATFLWLGSTHLYWTCTKCNQRPIDRSEQWIYDEW